MKSPPRIQSGGKFCRNGGRDGDCGTYRHEDERPLEKRRLAADDAEIDLLALVGLVDRRLQLDMNVIGFRLQSVLAAHEAAEIGCRGIRELIGEDRDLWRHGATSWLGGSGYKARAKG